MLHFVVNLDIDLHIQTKIQQTQINTLILHNVRVATATECVHLEIFTDRTEKSFSCGLLFTYFYLSVLFFGFYKRGNWAVFVTETTKASQ